MRSIFSGFFRADKAGEQESTTDFRAKLSFYTSRNDETLVRIMPNQGEENPLFVEYFLRAARIAPNDMKLLSEELDMLQDYIACYQKAKFSSADFYVQLNILNTQIPEIEVPAFILFPLVQNAIFQGYNSMERFPLKVNIQFTPTSLSIQVSNRVNHHILSQQSSEVIENYKARLAQCFPDTHSLLLNSNSNLVKSTLNLKF